MPGSDSSEEESDNRWTNELTFDVVARQFEQYRLKSARIVSAPGYVPEEVWMVWESLETCPVRTHIFSRGFLTKNKKWLPISIEVEKSWRYYSWTMSDDCKLAAFVSESIECGHERDVIQVESVQLNKALFSVVIEKDEFHGSIFLTGPHCHFKLSPGPNRRLLYLARPTHDQMKTKNKKDRLFILCIYDFNAKGIVTITDENICEKPINAIEWTPDGRGIVFHRDTELVWHRFGEYINIIYSDCPAPLKITFSTDETRLAVFLPTRYNCDSQILLYHWPFVKAAVQFKHDVVSLGEHKVWSIPDRPWANSGKDLIFNANWQHTVVSYIFTTETCALKQINFPRPAVIADVQEDEMLFETVSANSHTRLWHTMLPSVTGETDFEANLITAQRPAHFEDMYNFHVEYCYFGDNAYTGVLFMTVDSFETDDKVPLVVIPYHGDKPNFTDLSQNPMYSAFANCGLCVLIVNNRSSIGPLHNGYPEKVDLNVADDVHNAVLETLKTNDYRLDPNWVCLYGSDYASFVIGSILLKHPDFYKCAVFAKPNLKFPRSKNITKEEELYLKEWEPFSNPGKFKHPVRLVCEKRGDKTLSEFVETLKDHGVIVYLTYIEDEQEELDHITTLIKYFKNPMTMSLAADAFRELFAKQEEQKQQETSLSASGETD